MLFEKPKDLKYTDMAIWIDNNAYLENCDDNKLYEYIYHIVRMLAYTNKYFTDPETYENFSCYGATRTYFRLKNKKQFETKPDGTVKMQKIKSILNFLKTTIYPLKVDYEQQEYSQINQSDNPHISLDDIQMDYTALQDKCNNDEFNIIEFECYISHIKYVIQNFLKKIPEFSVKDEWINLYLSCLLTLLNSITLTNKDLEQLKATKETLYDDKLEKLYQKEAQDCVILFHLPESMRNYIFVLCNRIKKVLAKDLSDIINTYETPESIAKYAILDSVTDLYSEDKYD